MLTEDVAKPFKHDLDPADRPRRCHLDQDRAPDNRDLTRLSGGGRAERGGDDLLLPEGYLGCAELGDQVSEHPGLCWLLEKEKRQAGCADLMASVGESFRRRS